MSYTPDKKITVPGAGGHYESWKIQWANYAGYAQRCGQLGSYLHGNTYSSEADCKKQLTYDNYWRNITTGQPCTQGSSNCALCVSCIGQNWVSNPSTTQVEK
jgi:hypothetical protein